LTALSRSCTEFLSPAGGCPWAATFQVARAAARVCPHARAPTLTACRGWPGFFVELLGYLGALSSHPSLLFAVDVGQCPYVQSLTGVWRLARERTCSWRLTRASAGARRWNSWPLARPVRWLRHSARILSWKELCHTFWSSTRNLARGSSFLRKKVWCIWVSCRVYGRRIYTARIRAISQHPKTPGCMRAHVQIGRHCTLVGP
jgi:hypothetical protein